MKEYWKNPQEDIDIPECCGEYMTINEDGSCICQRCKRSIEPADDIDLSIYFADFS